MTEHGANEFDATEEMDRDADPDDVWGPLPESIQEQRKRRLKPIRLGVRMLLFLLIIYFLLPLIPRFRDAADQIKNVQPLLIVLGFALQLGALFSYSLLTRASLGEAARPLSNMRMFRIQLSTKALTNVVPGGNAAGSALGYRLLTLSGVSGPEAGFALATAGLGSAVVLNLIFWFGLIISIPRRGVNAYYGSAALAGIIVILIAVFLVVGIMEGQQRSEKAARWIATKLRLDPDKFASSVRQIAFRVEVLIKDRQLLRKVLAFALLNWLLDAASLWVFVRAFGETIDLDALLVAFGIANLLAAIPLTPGGLGYVDGAYIFTLVGFGIPERVARLGVATYRFAQFFFPILLGGLAYLSLRVGPWQIERRDRLRSLRELARSESVRGESRLDFFLRSGSRRNGDNDVAESAESAGSDGSPESAESESASSDGSPESAESETAGWDGSPESADSAADSAVDSDVGSDIDEGEPNDRDASGDGA